MADSIIVSIPYSGTRFLKERLGIEEHEHPNVIPWDQLLERVQGRQIVVPMRNPEDVFRSWCRRRSAREEDWVLNWIGRFFLAYSYMHTLDQMFDIDYICVDRCEDERITDWTKVGDDDQSAADWKIHGVDLRMLYDMPFVSRFYEPTINHKLHILQPKGVANV